MKKTEKMACGALMLALILVFQYFTAFFGSQLVTGTLVNLALAAAAVRAGLGVAATVACLSPVAAFALGIGPKIPFLIPFIMLANCVYVIAIAAGCDRASKANGAAAAAFAVSGVAVGSVLKCLFLFLSTTLVLKSFVALSAAQSGAVGGMFSLAAFVSCLAGGLSFLAVDRTLRSRRVDPS